MQGKQLVGLVLTGAIIILSGKSLLTKETGTPIENGVGYAGGIAEQGRNCGHTSCHNIEADPRDSMIVSNVPPEGYRRWTRYDFSVTVTDPSRVKFGFMASPQSATGSAMGFLFTLDDSVQTRLGIDYIAVTHTKVGNQGPNNYKTWNFQWSPPNDIGVGDLYFFVACNIANSNDTSTGDLTYIDTLIIPEALNNGVNGQLDGANITMGPNPVCDYMTLRFSGKNDFILRYTLHDLTGRIVLSGAQLVGDSETITLDVASQPAGQYLLRLASEDESAVVRLAKH